MFWRRRRITWHRQIDITGSRLGSASVAVLERVNLSPTLGFSGEGLVHDKKCTILMASGGVYTQGSPLRDRDIATNYLRLILKVIGIEDVTVVAGGNAKSVDMGQTTRDEFLQTFASEVAAAAA